jgi:hypothetical protein
MQKWEVKRMVKIATSLSPTDKNNLTPESILEIIEKMYIDLANAINSKPDFYERTTDGQTDDYFLANGSININTSTNKVEMLTNHVDSTTVTWTTLG